MSLNNEWIFKVLGVATRRLYSWFGRSLHLGSKILSHGLLSCFKLFFFELLLYFQLFLYRVALVLRRLLLLLDTNASFLILFELLDNFFLHLLNLLEEILRLLGR